MEKEVSEDELFTQDNADQVRQKERQDMNTQRTLLFSGRTVENDYDKNIQSKLFCSTVEREKGRAEKENPYGDLSIVLLILPFVVGVVVAFVLRKKLRRVHNAEYDSEVL